MGWTPDVKTSGIFSTLTIQAIIGFVFYVLFEIFRGQREIYAPRLRSKTDRCPGEEPPRYPFGWVLHVWKITEEDTLRMVGMDGFVMLRFFKMCTKLFLLTGCIGLVVLLPVYSTAPGEAGAAGIGRLTMANITLDGDRLYAACFCTWIFTILCLYLFYAEYEHFTRLRQKFMREGDPDLSVQQLYSVVVENIPRKYRSSQKLKDLFEELFPGQIVFARIGMKLSPIIKASTQRKKILVKLEQSVAKFEASGREDMPMVKVKEGKQVCCGGTEEREAVPFFAQKLREGNAQVSELKQQAAQVDAASAAQFVDSAGKNVGDDGKQQGSNDKVQVLGDGEEDEADPLQGEEEKEEAAEDETGEEEENNFTLKSIAGTGFVTLSSMRAQAIAYQAAVLSDRFPHLTAFKAPQPEDILWSNVAASLDSIKGASSITKAIYITGILFWALIIAFIAAFSSLSNLESFLPFLSSLDPVTYSILEGQLPVIILIVVMALLPIIFAAVSTYFERRKTGTDVQMQVLTWFFAYQIANVYLTLLAGSVLGALTEVLGNPASVIELVGTALPTVSAFFINLLSTMLLSGVPLLLLRPVPLLIWKIYRSLLGESKLTRRMLIEGPLAPQPVKYSILLPRSLYVLCIGLTYWTISPFVTFIAGLYFGANFMAWKYQLCYVINNNVETGGMYWYKLFSYSMTGLMATSVTMVAYMAIREGAVTAPLTFPLPFIVYFAWGYLKDRFEVLSANLAYSKAVHADVSEGAGSSTEAVQQFSEDFFLPPVLAGEQAELKPEVYRVEAGAGAGAATIPLLNSKGCLDEAYFKSTVTEIEALEALGSEVAAADNADADVEKGPSGQTAADNTEHDSRVTPMEIEDNSRDA